MTAHVIEYGGFDPLVGVSIVKGQSIAVLKGRACPLPFPLPLNDGDAEQVQAHFSEMVFRAYAAPADAAFFENANLDEAPQAVCQDAALNV